ncbi:oxidoreductase [Roseovarius sp. HI0049]|nr:oxidoreductase [Roseovarius sp. HI0049]
MRKLISILAAVAGLWAGPALAEPLDAPQGDVVLTVSGAITETNSGETAAFDMDMLKAMPATTFETTTVWTEGKSTFAGVVLAEILDRLGATGGTVVASAINDYSIEIPVESITPSAPVVAYELDGASMSRRQKGPLWIVYPYDSDAAFRTEVIYARSIWQLDRLEIVQ